MPRRSRRTNSTHPHKRPGKPHSGASGSSNLKDVCTVKIDWFQQQNTSRHHTDEYENDALVLRRGDTFQIGMTFQGKISASEILKTILKFSIEPKPANQTLNAKYIGIERRDNSDWGMVQVDQNPGQLYIKLEINIPVNTAIGRYTMDVAFAGSSSKLITIEQSEIIIIFNPWNKDDEVYLDKQELRKEYVLNETGLIYQGSSRDEPYPKRWNFGQFEEDILDCVLRVLEKDKRAKKNSAKVLEKRKSPVWVSRFLSAVLNSLDDDGVLEGNWTGDYEDGVAPSSWNGSVKILQQYFQTGKPVKYGQCWVFSGIMTTALRTLGIPARSVTNFDSAHDTDETMTIDKFYDEDGNTVDDLNNDSIWNFHVWNEIWTKRKDLPDNKYDGWQAVDSTPQEESSGLYQMGPAPLKAVKEGEIYAGFDTGFVFSEVNADSITWTTKKDESDEIVIQKAIARNSSEIGKFISTKKVGRNEREDITHLYKHNENSPQEAKAFETAYSFGKGPETFPGYLNMKEEGKELTIDLNTRPEKTITNGENFTLEIDVKNNSKRKLTVNLTGVVNSIQYTGEVKALVKRQKFEGEIIDAGRHSKYEIHVAAEDYVDKLTDLNCLKFVVVVKVLETGNQYVDHSKMQLFNKNCIEISWKSQPKVNEKCEVAVTFTNPLPIRLSNLTFTIEGAGLTKAMSRHRKRLGVGKKRTIKFRVKPRRKGLRTLLVDIDSSQAKDIKGFDEIIVSEA